MKTQKKFKQQCSELSRRVLEQGDVEWEELIERPYDYYDPSSGSVLGLIYYCDTVEFAKENHLMILKAVQQYEDEIGELTNKPKLSYNNSENEWENETEYFNWLAWFSWETMMTELISYLEWKQ